MNSKQRRKQRVFEHEVTMSYREAETYREFDARVARAKGWLQWNTKSKNYALAPMRSLHQTFKFRDGGLASVFALRFL